jgi:DNA polymerase elongation subunit (family B)
MNEDLYVVDWHSMDVDNEDETSSDSGSDTEKTNKRVCNNKFIVKAFCIDDKGETIVLNIQDFKPFYYIKVPNHWQQVQGSMFVRALKKKVKEWCTDTLVDWKLLNAKPLYGFTANDKFRYMRLTFSCLTGFYTFRNILQDPLRLPGINQDRTYLYELYESNLQPLLRFMHCNNLKAAGWINVTDARPHFLNNTTCKREATTTTQNVKAIDRTDIPPINYMGFDIEADSSHGDFPIANKDYQKLARDIVTDYNLVRDERIYSDMRPILATYMKYAFHPYYSNNNIRSIKLLNQQYPTVGEILSPVPFESVPGLNETIHHWSKDILAILQGSGSNQDRTMELLSIFEENFPAVDMDVSDYYQCSVQLIVEVQRLQRVNDVSYTKSPTEVLKLLLALSFDPYYNNLGINRIYNKTTIPALKLRKNLIPSMFSICDRAFKIAMLQRKSIRYRKMGVKKKVNVGPVTIDDCVNELNEVLNRYLPEVEDDKVIQIGSTFKKYGTTDCYLKHIICLKDTEAITNEDMIDFEFIGVELPEKELKKYKKKYPGLPDKALSNLIIEGRRVEQHKTDKSGVIVECYETEEEVLLAWQRLVSKENPDIVVGYNTFGFDYKYMYDRAEQLGIIEEFTQLGRMKGVSQKLIEKKLQSAGLGDNMLYIIEMYGRISIDLYKVMQKMYSLNSYKLDSVCKEFLFKAKVDVSPQEIFVKQKGTAADRRTVAEYCLIDCILCVRLMDKLELIINNIGMAQVCSVPISYLFLRGQGIKLFSFVARICRDQGFLIPVLGEPEDEGKYEGATVLDPDKGIHNEPVVVADFNSLYPSCMISHNLSHNSFVSSKVVKKGEGGKKANVKFTGVCLEVDNKYERSLIAGDYEGWGYEDIVYDVYKEIPVAPGRKKLKKIVVGHKICRFAQPPDGKKDIIPTTLMDLLAARKKAKKMRDTFPEGSFQYNIYEGLQLAYKVTANSLYGIIGAATSQIRLREIAACTTAIGRGLIEFSANFVTTNYPGCEITYGDTDSIFCKFKCYDIYGNQLYGLDAVNQNILLCTEASMLISKLLKKPHNLEFEKAILPFLLLSKKRYHGHYYTKYGNPKFYANSMGIVLKRRDNAPIVKHIFGKMVDIIMKEQSVDKAIEFVKTECIKVLQGEFPLDMFIIAKTLRSYYKNPNQIAHNVLAQRIGKRDPGNKPRGNDRIAYAFIVNADAEMQGDMIETPEFIKEHKCKIDYAYYITNQIAKPVLQIFALANKGCNVFDNILREYASVGWRKIYEYDSIHLLERSEITVQDAWKDLSPEDVFGELDADLEEECFED